MQEAHIYGDTNCVDFEADTVHKAILKLHRLNRLQHRSGDDWAHNMLEATADLLDPKDQTEFIQYLSNPSGYKGHDKLWNTLENWEKENTPAEIQKEVQPDYFDPDVFTEEGTQVGATMYIHVKNKTKAVPVGNSFREAKLHSPLAGRFARSGTIYEQDEKVDEV